MAIVLDGVVSGPTGYLNGAQVDAWNASRFTSIPGAGDPPPAGQPDAGPVLSGTNFGGPGQWQLAVPSVAAYYVRVTYPVGATNAKSYWAYDDSLVLTTGPQGVQGDRGYQGYQGNQGPQGTQGTQGVQGSVGFTGPQGFQGSQGPQGNMGAQGVQGTQGTQGYQGFQGLTGPQGTQGAPSTVQGPQGYQGFQGLTGPQGNQGTIGNTGAQGPQGYQGSTGPQGTQGYQGTMGNTGAQGPQGFQGNVGPQGSQGFQGDTGSQGPQGLQGPQGNQGAQGPQGFQGVQGATGSQGAQGNQGAQGSQGVGVPTGGTTGQALIKNSGTNYDTGWQSQLPLTGGTMSGNINMNSVARMTGLLRPSALGQPMRVDEATGLTGPSFYTTVPILAWTINPEVLSSGQGFTLVSGTTYVISFTLPYDATITGVRFIINQAGAGVTAGNISLMDATTVRAQTTSTTPWTTAAVTRVDAPFSATYAATAGTYWIAYSCTFSTTAPVIWGAVNQSNQVMNMYQNATTNSLATTRLGNGITIPALGSSLTTTPSNSGSNRPVFFAIY